MQQGNLIESLSDSSLSDDAKQLLERIALVDWLPADFGLEQVIETHVSLIFLGSGEVLKIKKKVDLGFVNHLNLSQRFQSCTAEVLLNRRLSTDVYKGLRYVLKSNDKLKVSELVANPKSDSPLADHVVEVVVVMRRLQQQDCLENFALSVDKLDAEYLRKLAAKLATFHQNADPLKGKSGVVKSQIEAVKDNFVYLDKVIVASQSNSLLDAYRRVKDYSLSFIDNRSDELYERFEKGHYVDAHGDLRAEHVYFEDDRVEIIDCIEFNRSLRLIDRLCDLAFLKMDLQRLSRGDWARVLTDQYQQLSQKFSANELEILNFYSCYRATVRAKISIIQASAESISDEEKEKKIDECNHYINLASRYAAQIPERILFMVGGYMGVGKSTVASYLGQQIGAKILRTDLLRKEVFDEKTPSTKEAFESGRYSRAARDKIYERMRLRALQQIDRGNPVILDATFSAKAERQAIFDLCSESAVKCVLIFCDAEKEIIYKRLQERERKSDSISDARAELLEKHVEQYQRPDGDTEKFYLVRTDNQISSQITRIIDDLREVQTDMI